MTAGLKPPTRPNLDRALAGLLVASVAAHWLWLILPWDAGPVREWVANLIGQSPLFLAALLLLRKSLNHKGVERLAWGLVALAVTAWMSGDLIWTYLELVVSQQPFPSVADLAYMGFPILMTLGFLHMPRERMGRLKALRLGLDTLIMAGAAAVPLWYFLLSRLVETSQGWDITLVASLLYPMANLILISLVISLALKQRGGGAVDLGLPWLGTALVAVTAADLYFYYLDSTGAYATGHPVDGVYSLAVLGLGLAGYAGKWPPSQTFWARWERWESAAQYLPYLALGACLALAVTRQTPPGVRPELPELGVALGTLALVVLVFVRQIVAVAENQRLSRALAATNGKLETQIHMLDRANLMLHDLNANLERRVAERTGELESSQARLLASEKLASLGKLTAGLAHEINTPLAATRNYIHQARTLGDEYSRSLGVRSVTDDDHREIAADLMGALERADITLDRLGELVRKMRNQTRMAAFEAALFDPAPVVRECLAMLAQEAQQAQVALAFEPPAAPVQTYGEPGRLGQVVTNLVVNAIHACEEHRTGEPSRVTVRLCEDVRGLRLTVRDNGGGIPADVLPKIFDPLFTTKEVGKGTGLGLSIVYDIVKGHFGGELEVQTEVGRGTAFALTLPPKAERRTT